MCSMPLTVVIVNPCLFYQAEDGIRDWSVTGVQTCALPISRALTASRVPPPASATAWIASRPTTSKRSEEHTSELQSLTNLVCRLLLEKKKNKKETTQPYETERKLGITEHNPMS